MALRLPIVSYPEAIKGIDCVPGRHLLLADNPQDFARLTLDLLNNPQRREEMGWAARQHVEENFSWDSRAGSFERLYLRRPSRSRRRRNSTPYPPSENVPALVQ